MEQFGDLKHQLLNMITELQEMDSYCKDVLTEIKEMESKRPKSSTLVIKEEDDQPINIEEVKAPEEENSEKKIKVNIANNSGFVLPDEQLITSIVEQVEDYFNESNSFKHSFLHSVIQRNKDGYVGIKFLSSLRKMKSLTQDWRVVSYSLEFSDILELNNDGTKVRRKGGNKDYLDGSSYRTVIIANAPSGKLIDLYDYFTKFGEVSSIWLLRRGEDIPDEVHKFFEVHPEFKKPSSFCIEYKSRNDALKAAKVGKKIEKYPKCKVMLLESDNELDGDISKLTERIESVLGDVQPHELEGQESLLKKREVSVAMSLED